MLCLFTAGLWLHHFVNGQQRPMTILRVGSKTTMTDHSRVKLIAPLLWWQDGYTSFRLGAVCHCTDFFLCDRIVISTLSGDGFITCHERSYQVPRKRRQSLSRPAINFFFLDVPRFSSVVELWEAFHWTSSQELKLQRHGLLICEYISAWGWWAVLRHFLQLRHFQDNACVISVRSLLHSV